MTFCIITHVNHFSKQSSFFAYAPYVREMNIWFRYVDEVIIVAPLEKTEATAVDLPYKQEQISFKAVPDFDITSIKQIIKTLFSLPILFYTVFSAMQIADHIHLRCPGNMGLIGCIVQILFPNKKKTAKYAGNWDPKAKQPWSYRLQKWILNNTFLTKNMQVLVYGDWEGSSVNIKSFFTATYSEVEKEPIISRKWSGEIQLLFVGALAEGKRPLYAVQLVQKLREKGINASLRFFGEGAQRQLLENYIATHHLTDFIKLEGNQNKETVLAAYKSAHFLILASKSEGWPKVVAEAMFWGCIPLATKVSCVPTMLDNGSRGVLLQLDLEKDVNLLMEQFSKPEMLAQMTEKAGTWSRRYTLEKFESEIKALL